MEARRSVSKDEVITKLKDDGDFDKLRLKIIRKLKDNVELRNGIIEIVKQSAALNRDGSENMKPRQLSDAIYEEVGDKVMNKVSVGLWEIIRSPDGMKREITETVQSVYNKLENSKEREEGGSSSHDVMSIQKEAGKSSSIASLASKTNNVLCNSDPKEPPGFCPSGNYENNLDHQHKDELPHEREPSEQKEEVHQCKDDSEANGISDRMEHDQPGDDSDEDPDVPPGFG